MTETPLLPAPLELAKARRLVEAAEHLQKGGFYEDAVSRAYYAIFHAGCALLASIGRTVGTHEGLRAAIGEHFVRPGKLVPHMARILARTAADRNDADYNSATTFAEEDAKTSIEEAREFLAAIEALVSGS